MKITDITLESYSWPRHTPIRNGKHVYTHSGVNLVTVKTDDGVEGVGLSAAGGPFAQAMIDRYKTDLIGEDPVNVERLWHKMWIPKLTGRRGLTTRVISGIDIALWDLRGKVAKMPLYKLLGGAVDRIPTYIAGGYYEEGKGLRELQKEMEDNVNMGAQAIKMKIGGVSIREDVERVKAVREAIGPDVKLLVDANCAYRVFEAIQIAKRMEEFDPYWFEEPLPPDDYRGHAQIARATSIPIATGENEYTRYGFRDLIASEGVAILNADAKILGGITEFMKVAAFAQAYDLTIAPHGAQEVHVHLVCAIQNGLLLEFYRDSVDPMWGKIYFETLSLNSDGTVSPSQTPGLGITPNYESLKPYRVG